MLDSNAASMEHMQYARICIEVVEVKYHWKLPRCANCKKTSHNATQCKPKRISKTTGGAKPASPPMLAPLYKTLNSGANPLVVSVFSSCLSDPATAPREASFVLMDHKLPDGDQEGFELDPSTANGYPATAHLFADADNHHFLAGNPIHASTLAEVVHATHFSSEEPSVYSADFCDSTPNFIIKLSCKYAQDDFGTLAAEPQGCSHDGPDPVSQRGSLDSVSFGRLGVLTGLPCPVCCYPKKSTPTGRWHIARYVASPKSAKLLYKGNEMQKSEIFVFGLRSRKRAEMQSNEISAFGRDICNVLRCKWLRSCREDRGLYLLPCFGFIRDAKEQCRRTEFIEGRGGSITVQGLFMLMALESETNGRDHWPNCGFCWFAANAGIIDRPKDLPSLHLPGIKKWQDGFLAGQRVDLQNGAKKGAMTGQVENIPAPPPPRSRYGQTGLNLTDTACWVDWFPDGRQMGEGVGWNKCPG
ncbi:hypothetical protein Nepgr_019593 [Nepenthes gracilis]|uniref:Uncharacterized protein n=1 Tax=Nepenthes gracilis TaxID=150966 RepID=A0AAD3SVC0_NEPGR|nr:hypothetical protein Nepgr_019593 [Nepenthes gracilis]